MQPLEIQQQFVAVDFVRVPFDMRKMTFDFDEEIRNLIICELTKAASPGFATFCLNEMSKPVAFDEKRGPRKIRTLSSARFATPTPAGTATADTHRSPFARAFETVRCPHVETTFQSRNQMRNILSVIDSVPVVVNLEFTQCPVRFALIYSRATGAVLSHI